MLCDNLLIFYSDFDTLDSCKSRSCVRAGLVDLTRANVPCCFSADSQPVEQHGEGGAGLHAHGTVHLPQRADSAVRDASTASAHPV